MCGIAGIFTSSGRVDLSVLERMTDTIAHRGPDGQGAWIDLDATVGLGHRRLAIIDLSEDGRQPMHYMEGRYTLTFNGEIYNYIELRDELEQVGYRFKSKTDTEVLLALYHERKEKCLDELDGMFSFAIWDAAEKKLFCARDRFGEKPFYYAIHQGALLFASEMKALWSVGVEHIVDNKALFNYLAHGYVHDPNDPNATFYEGIRKLPAAHYFTATPQRIIPRPVRYWHLDHRSIDREITEHEASESFRHLFVESVSRRLRSDVPVGSSLSGGLDSSLVVCVIDELNRSKRIEQSTFSARFPGFARDEGNYMEMVIAKTNVRPHFVYPSETGLVEDLQKLFYHQEEPFGSASIYAQFCVMQLAKEKAITVLLDGQGADEILAGYHYYFADYLRELKRTANTRLLAEVSDTRPLGAITNGGRMSQVFSSVKEALPNGLKNRLRRGSNSIRNSVRPFFNKDFLATYSRCSSHQNAMPAKTLGEALYRSTINGGLEELLRYSDRNSMAHSREVRLPFLSHKLVEFVFSLPAEYKIRNGVTKFIMRQAFSDLLPPAILDRRDKIGYEPPQSDWLNNDSLRSLLGEYQDAMRKDNILSDKFDLDLNSTQIDSAIAWKVMMAGMLMKK